MGHHARPVSARILHQMDGRSHRRSERRVERSRSVGDSEHAGAIPYGNWEGNDEQSAALSVASQSAGAVTVERHQPDVFFLPGIVAPAAQRYAPLLKQLDDVNAVLKDLEVYRGDAPPV